MHAPVAAVTAAHQPPHGTVDRPRPSAFGKREAILSPSAAAGYLAQARVLAASGCHPLARQGQGIHATIAARRGTFEKVPGTLGRSLRLGRSAVAHPSSQSGAPYPGRVARAKPRSQPRHAPALRAFLGAPAASIRGIRGRTWLERQTTMAKLATAAPDSPRTPICRPSTLREPRHDRRTPRQ